MIVIYSTPTCAPCKVAYKRLDAEGIPFDIVDLTEDADALARLKQHHGLKPTDKIQTPQIQYDGHIGTIVDLTNIIAKYKERNPQ